MNPNYTSVLGDPWHCETPINLKPTFVNINFVDDNLHINDFIRDVNWNFTSIQQFLGELFILVNMHLKQIDSLATIPGFGKGRNVVSKVYNHINNSSSDDFSLRGWKNLRNAALKANFFAWLFFYGKIKTLDFLNSLNLVPSSCCAIYGLHRETINHLFHSFSKILIF